MLFFAVIVCSAFPCAFSSIFIYFSPLLLVFVSSYAMLRYANQLLDVVALHIHSEDIKGGVDLLLAER